MTSGVKRIAEEINSGDMGGVDDEDYINKPDSLPVSQTSESGSECAKHITDGLINSCILNMREEIS